jgi:polysaccharide biosynthesis protein PslH
MKILQLCNKTPIPPKDGGSLAVLNMAVDLVNQGHEVTILAVNTNKHRASENQISDELRKKIKFHFVEINTDISKLQLIRNFFFSRHPYIAERFISEDFRKKLVDLLQQQTFDIIQFEGPYLNFYLPDIRKHSKAIVSYRAHNLEHEIWKRKAKLEINPLLKIYLTILAKRIKRFESKFLNKYDILVPITQRDLNILNKMGNTKLAYVAPFGINLDKIEHYPGTPKFPSLFYLGALDWIPNQEGVIWFIKNVWPELREKYPDLEFHIAGRNAPDFMIRFFQQHGIIFHGEIDKSAEFFSKWTIMVSPIFSGSGMRVKIVEGMALGKVIVTTTIGTEGISTTHGKNILIADTAESFIKYIVRLLDNKELYDTISQNAVKFAEYHFDNMQIIKGLSQFYSNANG